VEDQLRLAGEKLEQHGKRRLHLAHHRLRQDPDQLQGSAFGHRTGFHRQGVFRGRPQGSGLPDHEGIPAFFAGQRQWFGQHGRPQTQPGQGRQQDHRHHHPEAQQPDEERRRPAHLRQTGGVHFRRVSPQPVWRSAEKPEEAVQEVLSVWLYRHADLCRKECAGRGRHGKCIWSRVTCLCNHRRHPR